MFFANMDAKKIVYIRCRNAGFIWRIKIAHSRIVSTFSLSFEWDIRSGNALISGRDIDETIKGCV